MSAKVKRGYTEIIKVGLNTYSLHVSEGEWGTPPWERADPKASYTHNFSE